MPSLTRSLVQRTRERAVSAADRVAAERFVRDWLGSRVAGTAAPTGRILRAYGERERALEERVFLSAALSHTTETDDLHNTSVTHPGCVVISTAWHLGQDLGVRGHKVLDAVLVGYDFMTRVGEALGPAHYRIFHNTATAGVFASAAAACVLLGLDEDRWVWALGNAGTQAAGLWQFNDEGAMSKPLHAGHAAAAGLRSALLAREGFTGPEAILEGDKGLFRALCPDARPEAVLAEAHGWKLPETSMKPYSCCRHTHPAIDAALEVRAAIGGEPPAGSRVRITSYPAAMRLTDRPSPHGSAETCFSIQYCVATTLLRGRPGLEAFQDGAGEEPVIRELLGRTSVSADAELAAAYPVRWGAGVEVDADGGRRWSARKGSAKGDPDAPLDEAELDAKALGLFAWAGMEARRGRALLKRCWRLREDGPLFRLP